ncbi:sugar phosphate isomerase/epimerase family protein [Streptomyces sp. BI20]|uniref:sugar phosphate isomerase/epimerase family protein n=1 Tax=Streptomyces sp. BI20 TaxID=3403460 RepID=UPI003C74BAEE
MKFAFSTLGLPGSTLERTLTLAATHGYEGVELRAHPEEPVHLGLSARRRTAVHRRCVAAGVRVLSVAGYTQVAGRGADEPMLAELLSLIGLAADLEAPFARVFPGAGSLPEHVADANAVRRLRVVAPFARRHGVRLLLETHDSHRTGAATARVLDRVAHPGVGALWDVLHTWLGGEHPRDSARCLTDHLGYVQVKDVASPGRLTPVPLGQGVLPLPEVVGGLHPDGWVCWEYEKRWYPDAPELAGLLSQGRAHLTELARAAGAARPARPPRPRSGVLPPTRPPASPPAALAPEALTRDARRP